MTGKIKKIMSDKPFGFISVEGESQDIFFHQDKLVGVSFADLHEGDTVSFETEENVGKDGQTRINAVNVQRA